jgi:hypothetical protein
MLCTYGKTLEGTFERAKCFVGGLPVLRPGLRRHPSRLLYGLDSPVKRTALAHPSVQDFWSLSLENAGCENDGFYRYNIRPSSAVKRNLSKRCVKVFVPQPHGGWPWICQRRSRLRDAVVASPLETEILTAREYEHDRRGSRKKLTRLTYSPISPSPGIRGRLSVDSSGGSRKPAHEQSKSDETTRKIAAADAVVALIQSSSFRKYFWMRKTERGAQP